MLDRNILPRTASELIMYGAEAYNRHLLQMTKKTYESWQSSYDFLPIKENRQNLRAAKFGLERMQEDRDERMARSVQFWEYRTGRPELVELDALYDTMIEFLDKRLKQIKRDGRNKI